MLTYAAPVRAQDATPAPSISPAPTSPTYAAPVRVQDAMPVPPISPAPTSPTDAAPVRVQDVQPLSPPISPAPSPVYTPAPSPAYAVPVRAQEAAAVPPVSPAPSPTNAPPVHGQDAAPVPPVSCTPSPVYATKGISEIESGLTVTYRRLNHDSATSFMLSPAFRHFVIDRLALGVLFQLQIIEDGPKTARLLGQAEYNLNMGRLVPYAGVGAGVDYTKSGNESATDFVLEPGAGMKVTFGGGLLGLGLQVPILFGSPTTSGFDILTRYAVYF